MGDDEPKIPTAKGLEDKPEFVSEEDKDGNKMVPFTKKGIQNVQNKKPSKTDLRTLQHLSKLKNLAVIDLNYCRRITGFLNDIRELENLIILDLSECGNVTGNLRDLRMLKKLQ